MKELVLPKIYKTEKIKILSSFFDAPIIELEGGTLELTKEIDGREIKIVLVAKCLSNSGWYWRPEVKRIQVKNYKPFAISKNTKTLIMMYVGLFTIGDEWMICVWNAFEYMKAKTIVSCYVRQELLYEAFKNSFAMRVTVDHTVFVTRKCGLATLINEFINKNALVEA